MKRINVIVAAILISALIVGSVQAHALLQRSDPPVGATLKNAPREIQLFFSEEVDPALSSIKVFDESGKAIDKGAAQAKGNKKSLLTASLPKLPLGVYKVVWSAVSADGHLTQGSFKFHVAR